MSAVELGKVKPKISLEERIATLYENPHALFATGLACRMCNKRELVVGPLRDAAREAVLKLDWLAPLREFRLDHTQGTGHVLYQAEGIGLVSDAIGHAVNFQLECFLNGAIVPCPSCRAAFVLLASWHKAIGWYIELQSPRKLDCANCRASITISAAFSPPDDDEDDD